MGVKKASDALIVIDDSKVFYLLIAFALMMFLLGIYVVFFDEPKNPIVGIICTMMGLILVGVGEKTEIAIDKARGILSVSRFSVRGQKKYDYPLEKVAKLQLRYQSTRSSEKEFCFILSDGSVLSYKNIIDEPAEASQVAAFIGVELEVKGPPSFQDVLETIKEEAFYAGQKAAEQKKLDKNQ